jgi:hypothetical protein
MSDSVLNSFIDACAATVTTNILPHIVDYVVEQKGPITVDGLVSYLKLPSVRPTYASASPVPASPFGGAAVPMMMPTTSSSSRKQTGVTTAQPGKSCTYQFKRGDNKGKYCGKPTSPGADFCAQCIKTRKNLQKEAPSTLPGVAPGLSTGLPGYNPPIESSVNEEGEPQNGGLSVVDFDPSRELFREPVRNFIIKQSKEGVLLVLGKLKEDNGVQEIVPLTEDETVYAKSIGLIVTEPTVQSPPPMAPMAPMVPTMGKVPGIPQIPSFTTAM